MDEIKKQQVIDLYLSGFGSTTIIKKLNGITKRQVLKTLNDKNLIKKKKYKRI